MPRQWHAHFGLQPGKGRTTEAWAAAVDIIERKDAYLVTARPTPQLPARPSRAAVETAVQRDSHASGSPPPRQNASCLEQQLYYVNGEQAGDDLYDAFAVLADQARG
jgi:hypothetical protein